MQIVSRIVPAGVLSILLTLPSVAQDAVEPAQRDAVGDLNAAAVEAGEFPGSILLPGGGNTSLAIGGFIKALAVADSDAETGGVVFLPALLGTSRNDVDGNFSIDSTLSRVFLDARNSSERARVRGYIEIDLNSGNTGNLAVQLRHAYGSVGVGPGTLTIGHTWSTLMDLGVLPNGLGEPTVSGPIFRRQPMIRWSQPLGDELKFDVAAEDPGTSDVFSNAPVSGRTRVPDLIGAVEFRQSRRHVRFGGIYRRLIVDTGPDTEASADAWGMTLGAHQTVFAGDRLLFTASYGEGLGRYLLGLQPADGGFIDSGGSLIPRRNYGGFLGYQHFWTGDLNSTAVYGIARVERLAQQPLSVFEGSAFLLANLLWSVIPEMTIGVEYDYGRGRDADGTVRPNHRVMVGFQIY